MSAFLIIIGLILLDLITISGIKRTFPKFYSNNWKKIKYAFVLQAAIAILIVIFGVFFQRKFGNFRIITLIYYAMAVVAVVYIPKAVYSFFWYIDWMIRKISAKKSSNKHIVDKLYIHKIGFWTGLPVVCLVLWGIFFGKYNFTIENVEFSAKNIPKKFDGYKIVQISDIHAGSFAWSAGRFQKAVDLINEQKPDIIVITGDIVNNFSDELIAFIPIFSQLTASDGKFVVLGNHDYGGYYRWKNEADSVENINNIIKYTEQMGFAVLNNEAVIINRGYEDSIAVIGVENWGVLKRFPKRADLKKAMNEVQSVPFKLLLTHDPSFWTKEVKSQTDIALTLAGHTHGMQMGIKLGNKHISPAIVFPRFRRYWIGLYQHDEQYLYINRGIGVVGLPMRIGMPPEITVITLRSL